MHAPQQNTTQMNIRCSITACTGDACIPVPACCNVKFAGLVWTSNTALRHTRKLKYLAQQKSLENQPLFGNTLDSAEVMRAEMICRVLWSHVCTAWNLLHHQHITPRKSMQLLTWKQAYNTSVHPSSWRNEITNQSYSIDHSDVCKCWLHILWVEPNWWQKVTAVATSVIT